MRIIITITLLSIMSSSAWANKNCLDFHVINSEPVGYINDENQLVGSQVEMLNALEAESGICINKTLMSFVDLWKSIERKEHDGGFILKNQQKIHLVKPLGLATHINNLVVPRTGISIKQFKDLYPLSIARAAGSYVGQRLIQDKKITLVDINNYENVFNLLKVNRIDAIVGSEIVIKHQAKKRTQVDNINFPGSLKVGKHEIWLQLSLREHQPETIIALQNALKALREKKTFESILDKYR